jgi:hypothetical protein
MTPGGSRESVSPVAVRRVNSGPTAGQLQRCLQPCLEPARQDSARCQHVDRWYIRHNFPRQKTKTKNKG